MHTPDGPHCTLHGDDLDSDGKPKWFTAHMTFDERLKLFRRRLRGAVRVNHVECFKRLLERDIQFRDNYVESPDGILTWINRRHDTLRECIAVAIKARNPAFLRPYVQYAVKHHNEDILLRIVFLRVVERCEHSGAMLSELIALCTELSVSPRRIDDVITEPGRWSRSTLFHKAASCSQIAAIRLLWNAMSDDKIRKRVLETRDAAGHTPIMCAVASPPAFRGNSAECVRFLAKDCGANIDVASVDGCNLLLLAARWSYSMDVVQLLVKEFGFDPKSTRSDGAGAIHLWALRQKHSSLQVLNCLMDVGCDATRNLGRRVFSFDFTAHQMPCTAIDLLLVSPDKKDDDVKCGMFSIAIRDGGGVLDCGAKWTDCLSSRWVASRSLAPGSRLGKLHLSMGGE